MIVVVGSINLDLVADVERLPAPGETVPGATFRTAPGGKGANQALAAARAGAEVRMIGAVGKDAFAGEALALLEKGGVDLSAVRRVHASTGVALIFVDGAGENVIVVVAGANGTVLPGDLATAEIARDDVLLFQHEIPLATVEAGLRLARETGARSVLNTAPFRPEAAHLLALADTVVANETEFDLYASELGLPGAAREERMRAFVAATGRTLVVTLGGDGVIAIDAEGVLRVPAMSIRPVDTVGAGDTFCGYLAASLAEGLDIEAALRRAAVAGSLACLEPGAQPSVPTRDKVEAALAASA
ncbi:MAG: ribokinase [Rhizobiaceae bacterium]|nr:ribokinase [Rhizobiaceae bacterium]